MDGSNNFYLATETGDKLYKVNVSTMTYEEITLSAAINTADFAFNPRDGRLYGAYGGSSILVEIDPSTGIVITSTLTGPSIPRQGGAFFDSRGWLYSYANVGELYHTPPPYDDIHFAQSGASSTYVDAAAAAFAPMLRKRVMGPPQVPAGDTVTYRFELDVASLDTNGDGFADAVFNSTFSDQLTFGTYVAGSLRVSTDLEATWTTTDDLSTLGVAKLTGTANAYGGTNQLTISGLNLPVTQDGENGYCLYWEIEVLIDATQPAGQVCNQAQMPDVPHLFCCVYSGDPATPEGPDPTCIEIVPPVTVHKAA